MSSGPGRRRRVSTSPTVNPACGSASVVEELLNLLLGAEAHHAFDTRTVVPTAVEDAHRPAGRKMGQVPLHVHLRLLALRRSRQRDHTEHPRTDPLGDRPDHPALPSGVATLEDDADPRIRRFHPLLQCDEFTVERPEQPAVLLVLHRPGSTRPGGTGIVQVYGIRTRTSPFPRQHMSIFLVTGFASHAVPLPARPTSVRTCLPPSSPAVRPMRFQPWSAAPPGFRRRTRGSASGRSGSRTPVFRSGPQGGRRSPHPTTAAGAHREDRHDASARL